MARMKFLKREYAQVFFVFIAFALIVLIGGFLVSNTLQKTSLSAVTVALNETEKTIRAYLREPKVAFDNIYTAIQDILDRGESQEVVYQYMVQTTDLLSTQADGVKGFNSVYGYIRGEFLTGLDWDYGDNYVPQERPWYQSAVSTKGVGYTTPYIDANTKLPIISLAQKIYGKNGDYYGVLALDVDISWLMGYAESLQFVDGGYGMILTHNLNIIAHPEKQYVNAYLQDLGEDYAAIADMLKTNRDVVDVHIKDIDGTNAIVFFKRLYNGWYVGVIMPTHSYYADLYFNIAALLVLGSVLAGILSFILLRLSAEKTKSEEESKAKSSFLATMSHEIRTPLNAIIGITQIELQKEKLPDEYAAAFEKIYSSGNGLLGIINDILDMSKIETGKLALNPTEYDVASLINDTVQLNMVRIGSKPIEFILDIDENLPLRVYGDELRIKQILNNLLSNAIKYTDKGYVKLSVGYRTEGGSVEMHFSVEDTGQGMKSEDKARLFSEYLRFNAVSNRTTEGTGLGLSITKRLLAMMDGTIDVESEYGKGSIFTVKLKQKAVKCSVFGPELAGRLRNFTFIDEQRPETLQITRAPMPYGRVLVVDDVETNLFVARGLLNLFKLNIETASSGFMAIDKIKNGNVYDVIFMDHMMPRMDGIETTQKLRALGYNGAIVALTANALVGNNEMFLQNGFDGFISKPIDAGQLNAVLNKFIRDRHPEEAKKYTPEIAAEKPPEINPKLLQIFRADAEKAIATLWETTASGDIKLFTTTVHAMKSALANVGEHEASARALALEDAGNSGDMPFICANTKHFIEILEVLNKKFTPADTAGVAEVQVIEDADFLKEQMQIFKTACENYDDDTAYAALDRLTEKKWHPKTAGMLEKIRDTLFLHSDFDEAAKMAGEILR